MTPTRAKIHWATAVFLAALAGCATAPDPAPALLRAEAAIARARQADAATHAPGELRLAASKLDAARAAGQERDADAAQRLAAESEVDADLALAASRRVRAEAAVKARELENEALKSELLDGDQGP